MKANLILFAFLLFSATAFSQSKNNISVIGGFASSNINIHGVLGDYGYSSKGGSVFGVNYTRDLTSKFSIITGVMFSNDKVQLHYLIPGMGQAYREGNIKMVSIPVYAKYAFVKWLYVDAGFSADFQSGYNSSNSIADEQSGIGAELGFGGQYSFGPVTIFANPYYHYFAFTRNSNNLMETGVKFGLGYNF